MLHAVVHALAARLDPDDVDRRIIKEGDRDGEIEVLEINEVAGTVRIKGQTVTTFTPQAAVTAGVGYVPRERKIEGIVAGMSVFENMTLSQMGRHSRSGVLNVAAERALARDWIAKLDDFLKLSEHELLDHAGKITAEQAKLRTKLQPVLAKYGKGGAAPVAQPAE